MEPTDSLQALVVFTTFPDLDTARQIGTKLVEEQVAACVNLLAPGESIYRWKGAVESAREIPALIKTTRAAFPMLEAAIRRLHPYEVPEILAVPVESGSVAYLRWLEENILH